MPPLDVPPLADEDVPPDALLLPLEPEGVLLVPADVLGVPVVPAELDALPPELVPPLPSSLLLPPHAAESASGSTSTEKLNI